MFGEMSSLRILCLVLYFTVRHQLHFGASFWVEENQGIILAIPTTGTFILLNEYVNCITLENTENNIP